MEFTFIELVLPNHDYDENLIGYKYCGQIPGCGCCSGVVGINSENLNKHIQYLESALEYAKSLIGEI